MPTTTQLGTNKWLSKAFNTRLLEDKRLPWIDYLRGIAIILIVYRHVLIGIQRGQIEVPEYLVDANMVFYSFRMPLFFILSGIFISKSLQKKSAGELGWIKFETLLYPYLIWTFIQITLQIALSNITNSDRSFIDYTYIFYQPRILDQFWYLPALFNATIVFILLKSKARATSWMQIALGIVFYFLSPYFKSISMLSDWMEFYVFFALGDVIARPFFKEKVQRFFKSGWTLLAIIPFFIAAQWFYLKELGVKALTNTYQHGSRYDYLGEISDQALFLVIALIGCLSMFILAFRLQELNVLRFLRILGFHSLYIYVMHVIITAFVRLSLIIIFGITDPVALLLTSMTMGIIIPIAVYNLCIKNNFGWFLFSYKHPEPKPKMKEKESTISLQQELIIPRPAVIAK
jgi:fucose 4-O-acetylase-like acetyltransferase